jgi:hypothetical protein
MMDAGTGIGKLRRMNFFAVVNHQRDVEPAVGHVTRHMPARTAVPVWRNPNTSS